MIVYKYGNYISDDKEKLEEKILDDISKHIKCIGTAEAIAEDKCAEIEEFNCSCKGLFDLMRQGYVFIDHCGKDNE